MLRSLLLPALLLTLAGCGGAPAAPAPTTEPAPTTTSAAATTTPPTGEVARCVAADLRAGLGEASGEGQRTVSIVYRNVSDRPCEARGVPGVDLRGPDDPNGPVYSVLRQEADGAGATLEPGGSVSATLTYLTDSDGSVGTLGSTGWVPTELVTTPPGDTSQLTVPWNGDTVLRQDGATRPGTYVGPLAAS
ncbi:DUF4232 domain-containing protein [Pseudonocardia abyssalis]|jgi:hypothetical protein|uniref:DUF4232 domain-containing protein n=1 Tax=Pseudonocardia abyssalis TaxID=2792008 RepID=A0ABS6UQE9_9PSEU|nr:DUF4232 domain-containing protein [Pseudonocardia abyssalis]MBW0134402.1 DUF4232 domain-containing protein [Pseudonocardia abyssalis]